MNAPEDDRERADWGADPDLLDVLRGADPAHSLPPSSPAGLTSLVEAVLLTADRDDRDDDRSRRRLVVPWVAVAAVVLIAGVVGLGLGLTRDGRQLPTAGPGVAQPADPGTDPGTEPDPGAVGTSPQQPSAVPPGPTVLQLPAVTSGRCAVPTAESLAQQAVAFSGVVSAVEGGTATLSTTGVFAGAVSDQVEVRAPSQQMGELLSAVQFEPGRRYLVSATDGQVTLCGFSAEDTPDLRALYQQAFTG